MGTIILRIAWTVLRRGTLDGHAPVTALVMIGCGIGVVASAYGLLKRLAWGVHVLWSSVFCFGLLLGWLISRGGKLNPVQGGLYQQIGYGRAAILIGVQAIIITAVALGPVLLLRRVWRPNVSPESPKDN